MKDKAIAKITDEATKINSPVAFAIEEHLTELCTTNAVAEKLLAEDKTLKGAYDLVWKEAKRRAKDRCAYIPPEEVWDIVEKYYGIDNAGTKKKPKKAEADMVDVLDLL